MTTLRKISIESAIQDWFKVAVLPQLPTALQIGIAFGHRAIGREVLSRMMQYKDFYKSAETIDENENFNAEVLEDGINWLFENRGSIEADIFGTPITLTKLNLQELLQGARRIESQTQAQA